MPATKLFDPSHLDAAQKARRRRKLAAIHIEAPKTLGPDWQATLCAMVYQISGGYATSCAALAFDELRAVLQRLRGEPVTEPTFRKRLQARPVSQTEYLQRLIGQVNARSVTTGGPEDFSQRVLAVKVHETDVSLMTTPQIRQAIAILRSYVK